VKGRFEVFSGTIIYDQKDITNSSVDVSIKTISIDTGNDRRDGHLRTSDFFDADSFPEITFQSTSISEEDGQKFANGALTIRGVKKDVRLPFEIMGVMKDKEGNTWAGFESGITINRKDFGITWNRALEDRGFLLGDEVTISLFIEGVMMKAEKKKG
jgi:polyisoprenoid-binding protein YceI